MISLPSTIFATSLQRLLPLPVASPVRFLPGNTIPDAVFFRTFHRFNTTLSVNGTNFITNSLLFALMNILLYWSANFFCK